MPSQNHLSAFRALHLITEIPRDALILGKGVKPPFLTARALSVSVISV